MAKIPASFLAASSRYILEYEALIEDAYNKIARMEGGRRDFTYWTPEQKKAFVDAISIHNYKDEKRDDPVSQLMRQAETELNGIMEDHLKGGKGPEIDISGTILQGQIGNMYTTITGKQPTGKVYATELKAILEEAEDNFWFGDDWSDGYLEDYWEKQGLIVTGKHVTNLTL